MWTRALLTSLALALSGCGGCRLTTVDYVAPFPDDQIDVFEQKDAALVDVLFMVDNSPSMVDEQSKLAARAREFMKQMIVSTVDYHVGVVSSDFGEHGVLRAYTGPPVTGCDQCRFLTNEVPCPNPDVIDECPAEQVFRNLVQTGTGGQAFEREFDQVAAALGVAVDPATGVEKTAPPPENAGFVRDQASLYLIFVSDEDEGAKNDAPPVTYYERAFRSLKGSGNELKVKAAAVAGYADDEPVPLDQACAVLSTTFDADSSNDDPRASSLLAALANYSDGCHDQSDPTAPNSFAETGSRYIELACRMDGVVTNLCSNDYSSALDTLGANAAGLVRRFTLSTPQDKINLSTNLDCDHDNKNNGADDAPLCVTAAGLVNGNASTCRPSGNPQLVTKVDDGGCGYTFDVDTNSIVFDGGFIPRPGTEVRVRYGLLP
jgi:hypothetical protein